MMTEQREREPVCQSRNAIAERGGEERRHNFDRHLNNEQFRDSSFVDFFSGFVG